MRSPTLILSKPVAIVVLEKEFLPWIGPVAFLWLPQNEVSCTTQQLSLFLLAPPGGPLVQ